MDDTNDNGPAAAATGPSPRARLWMIVGAVIVLLLTALYVFGIMYKPAYSANATANSAVHCAGGSCTVHLQIQPAVGGTGAGGPHSNWLGYQTDTTPVHPGTLITLPRNSTVTFIIRNFDSTTAPRNEFFALVQGTVGGV